MRWTPPSSPCQTTSTANTPSARPSTGYQFAAEIDFFSECVLNDTEPEPSGAEGLADVRIIQALYQSAQTGQSVALDPFKKTDRPDMDQEDYKPPVREPKVVHAESPHG